MSRAVPTWLETYYWLVSQSDGATWQEICTARSISRAVWRVHRKKIETFLMDHPEANLALPDATRETGFRFRITNEFVSADAPDIRGGSIASVGQELIVLTRRLHEAEVAYEKAIATEPAGKRSRVAKKHLRRMGRIAVQIEEAEKDLTELRGGM